MKPSLIMGRIPRMGRRQPTNRWLWSSVAALAVPAVAGAVFALSSRLFAPRRRRIAKSILINKPASEVYRWWRDFERLPAFMQHLESVTVKDPVHSHWIAKGPAGTRVEWDAEIVREQENELIEWRATPGAEIENSGSVWFRETPHGTQLQVELEYAPPAGRAGIAIAKILGEEPDMQVAEDLRRFKQLIEVGEVATTTGQSSGRP